MVATPKSHPFMTYPTPKSKLNPDSLSVFASNYVPFSKVPM